MAYKDRKFNKEWRKEYDKNKRLENNLFLRDYKESQFCKDCDEKFPHYIMELDHVRGKKEGNVSSMLDSRPKLLRELAKCDVVCGNCHNTRTWFRKIGAFVQREDTSFASLE